MTQQLPLRAGQSSGVRAGLAKVGRGLTVSHHGDQGPGCYQQQVSGAGAAPPPQLLCSSRGQQLLQGGAQRPVLSHLHQAQLLGNETQTQEFRTSLLRTEHQQKEDMACIRPHLSKLAGCRLSEGVQIFPGQMFLSGIKAAEE